MRHNIGYKLLSLLIAIMVWAYVDQYTDQGRHTLRVTRDLMLPITMRNLGSGLVITSRPKIVKVTLEGPKEYVDTITAEPDSVTANVFLNRRGEGHHRLPVIAKLPEGYTGLVSTTPYPAQVVVSIEKMAQKWFRVETDFTAPSPVGFRFSAPEIAPGKVIVKGQAAQLKKVRRVVVTVDPSAYESDSINAVLPIKAVDAAGEQVAGVELSVERVRVRLELERAPVSKVVFVTPNITGRPPFPHKVLGVEVSPQSVTLNGRPERLMEISTVSTVPLALHSHTKTFSQRVRLIAPSGTSLASGGSATITVTIGAAEAEPDESP